ncbi:MAG TPA: nuclear transport factor 2 family protein [Gemmatimonadales bacterium]|jgi:hypothetical protein
MHRLQLAALCLLLAAGCKIEDRTPTGTRQDEDAIQSLVADYARNLSDRNWSQVRSLFWRDGSYSGPMVPRSIAQAVPIDSALGAIERRVEAAGPTSFDVRVLRTDFRQDADLAAVWLTTRRRLPLTGVAEGSERDWVEHLVLRRIGGQWRILSIAGAASARAAPRESR